MTIPNKNLTEEEINEIRLKIPSFKNVICLNSGLEGPLPLKSLQAIQNSFINHSEEGTFTYESLKKIYETYHKTRMKIADFVSCNERNICLSPNTTYGINVAINGFNFNSDSEIITSKYEYPAVFYLLYNLKNRYGVKIKIIDIDFSNPLFSIQSNLSSSTKAVLLSHVYWSSGNLLLNLKEIIKSLREKNIISIIDGAQSVGAVDVNLSELNPDFYSAPGQKWLLGPKGTGFLYVNDIHLGKSPPWASSINITSSPFKAGKKNYDLNFNFEKRNDAVLFETGGLNSNLFLGLSASIDFLNGVGKENIFSRIQELSTYLIDNLKTNSKIEVLTSTPHAGLVSWRYKNISPSELVRKLLKEKKISIREIEDLNCSRASLHFFNTKNDIDLLLEVLS